MKYNNATKDRTGDMSRNLTISDDLYARLESAARSRGLKTVEELLDRWPGLAPEASRREDVVQRIDNLRARLFARYGQMSDSVELLQDDRAR